MVQICDRCLLSFAMGRMEKRWKVSMVLVGAWLNAS